MLCGAEEASSEYLSAARFPVFAEPNFPARNFGGLFDEPRNEHENCGDRRIWPRFIKLSLFIFSKNNGRGQAPILEITKKNPYKYHPSLIQDGLTKKRPGRRSFFHFCSFQPSRLNLVPILRFQKTNFY